MPKQSPPTDPTTPRAGERIAKLLARAGVASRREVERMIAEGRVAYDGVAIDTPATLLTSLAGITVDGVPVAAPAAARLFTYHKPVGLLVTERDPAGRPTIYDRLPDGLPRVVPVGRLDLATEGLLLLTTDGGLKRELELPATGVERTYRARAYGPVSQAQLEELIEGVEIEGIRYGRIDANLERRTGANSWIEMTLTEGKNREVRRVLEHLGLQVGRLIRTRYGPFVLGDMPPGAVGEIRQHDLEAFRKTLRLRGGASAGSEAVMAEPFVPAAAAPAPTSKPVDSPRTRTAPLRDGTVRRPTAARPAPRRNTQPGDEPRRERRMDDRPSRAGHAADADRPAGRSPRSASARPDKPRAFGDRARAATAARAGDRSADRGQRDRPDAAAGGTGRAERAPRPDDRARPRGGDERRPGVGGRRAARGENAANQRGDRSARPASAPDTGKPHRGLSSRTGGGSSPRPATPRDGSSPRPSRPGGRPGGSRPGSPRPSAPRGKR
jgi:23S rRNA pseudouridine2605 synthase